MAAEELLRELAGSRDRRAALELERALNAARCPKDSRFGEALVNSHFKTDHVYQRKLCNISNDAHRMAMRMNQLRQHFMRSSQCLNYEPLILVERSAGREEVERALYMAQHGQEPDQPDRPRYMKQLRSRCRTPSTLTTIDAFKVKPKQKRNVWESEESEPLVFKSTVRPSSRLTDRERLELSLGWNLHKPKVEGPATEEKESQPSYFQLPWEGDDADQESSPFITQLPRAQDSGGGHGEGREGGRDGEERDEGVEVDRDEVEGEEEEGEEGERREEVEGERRERSEEEGVEGERRDREEGEREEGMKGERGEGQEGERDEGERDEGERDEEERTLTKSSHNVSFASTPGGKKRPPLQGRHSPRLRDRHGNAAGVSSHGRLADSSEILDRGSIDPPQGAGGRHPGTRDRPQQASTDRQQASTDRQQASKESLNGSKEQQKHLEGRKAVPSGPRMPSHKAPPLSKRCHSTLSDPPPSPPDSPVLPPYMYTFNPRDFAKPGGMLLVTGTLPSRRSTRRRSKKAPRSPRVASPAGKGSQAAREGGKALKQGFPTPRQTKAHASKRSIRENTTAVVVAT